MCIRDRFWAATKRSEETYTLFGSRVKNLFLYYMDSQRVKSQEELVDLIVSDRIKQTLTDDCLKHVLSAEGDDWFHTAKLTSVVDTFVNSRLNMGTPRKGSDAAKPNRFGYKNSGTGSNLQDTGVPNKSFHTPGISKPPMSAGENKSVRCWTCGGIGHRSSDHSSDKPRPAPRTSLAKPGQQTQPSFTPATTPKTIPGQAKINHASVQCNFDYLPQYELVNKFPHKLTFPGSVVQQEESGVVEQIARIEAPTLSVDREMAKNTINDTTVSYCRAGMSCDSVEPLCSDVDVTAYDLHGNRVNKQTDLGNIGVSSTAVSYTHLTLPTIYSV